MSFIRSIVLCALAGALSGCNGGGGAEAEITNQTMSVTGMLKRHKPGSYAYWEGSEFTVRDTPILPTDRVPEEAVRRLVRTRVKATGVWFPGEELPPGEPLPRGYATDPDEPVVVGHGIQLQSLEPAPRE